MLRLWIHTSTALTCLHCGNSDKFTSTVILSSFLHSFFLSSATQLVFIMATLYLYFKIAACSAVDEAQTNTCWRWERLNYFAIPTCLCHSGRQTGTALALVRTYGVQRCSYDTRWFTDQLMIFTCDLLGTPKDLVSTNWFHERWNCSCMELGRGILPFSFSNWKR